MKFSAEIKQLPQRFVVAARHIGPYPEIPQAIDRLFAWAGPRGLVNFPETLLLGVFHDDPNTVQATKLRSDACITVAEGTQAQDAEHGIHSFCIPGGQFAVAHVEIEANEYTAAWQKLYEWMAENAITYDQTDDRLCYEVYVNDPEQHPEKKHIADICTPIS